MNPAEPSPQESPPAEPAGAPPETRSVRTMVTIVVSFLVVAILGLVIFFFAEQMWLKSWSRQTEAVPPPPSPFGG